MPEEKQSAHFESGRATPPQSVCYSSLLASASEEFTDNIEPTTNSSGQNSAPVSQSLLHTSNFNGFSHHRTQSSPASTYDYSSCPRSHPYYSPATSKTNVINLPTQSSHFSTDYLAASSTRSPSVSTLNNFSSFTNICSNNNSNSNNFEFLATSKTSNGSEGSFYITPETFNFQSSDQLPAESPNCLKVSKSNTVSTLKHTSTYLNSQFPSNTQTKYCQNRESIALCSERNTKLKKNSEGNHKFLKAVRDENFEDSQEFLPKNGTKVKNTQEANPDLVTDSLLHLFYKKNSQENSSYDLGDLSPILVSLTSKLKAEEISGLKKKESNEDFKLMNDFLAKIILEKEEKRYKSLDERKVLHKETFDDLNNDLEERKVKRDAMSHYQEDKNHHKRSTNYGDYNQWEYFNQQDIQSSNNHRRGHFSFSGSSQQHSVGWNPMGIGLPRQANPYYTNPHGHMMPAHAHSEYRYNQWNNPNHKNMPNAHNAHSQNTVLPQVKADMKHADNSVQDFGLPIGSTSDFSKFRAATRDLMHRPPPSSLTEKSTRAGIHAGHITSTPPAIRNSSLRTPSVPSHPKTVINNPLSDLQMLVTNQEGENLPQKADNFQQESVDLSAHSDAAKQKENSEEKPLNGGSCKDVKEFRSPVSVIQIQNKSVRSDFKECEKPVELTSKGVEKSVETVLPSSESRTDLGSKSGESSVAENAKETAQNEVSKTCEESVKASVIVGKCGETSGGDVRNEGSIPETVNITDREGERTEDLKGESEEKESREREVVDGESSSQAFDSNAENKDIDKPPKCTEPTEEVSNEPAEKNSESLESSRGSKRAAEDEEVCGEKKKVFLEVETQLEKLFDGGRGESQELPGITSTTAETKPVLIEGVKKTPKKKPSRKSRIGRLSSGQSSGSERSLPCKKSKSAGSREDGKKKIKKSLCDVMERRGPFLHVEGSKESPAAVILVNFPKGDDEDEKEKNSAKKQNLNANRTKHHNDLDYRVRSRNGLYSSTLSARYDAHTTDHTWVCVFCKKGPHYSTMGDLFGPYIISKDENTSLGDFSGDEKDISDAQKRGGRNKKSIRSNNMVEHFQKMSRKLRRTQSTESCLTGMTVISDDQTDQLRYEVWVHEQCAVWSPNVFLIGSRIIGMQEAIWCSVKTMCSKCGISGANIGCVYRNCPNRSHFHCAKESGWSLEQESFISTCHIHKPRS